MIGDGTLTFEGWLLVPLTFLALLFYLLAAWTNPGYLNGDERRQLKKATAWDIEQNKKPEEEAPKPLTH